MLSFLPDITYTPCCVCRGDFLLLSIFILTARTCGDTTRFSREKVLALSSRNFPVRWRKFSLSIILLHISQAAGAAAAAGLSFSSAAWLGLFSLCVKFNFPFTTHPVHVANWGFSFFLFPFFFCQPNTLYFSASRYKDIHSACHTTSFLHISAEQRKRQI